MVKRLGINNAPVCASSTCDGETWYYYVVFRNQTALEAGVMRLRQEGVYVESIWLEDRALVARASRPGDAGILTSLSGIADCLKRRDFESGRAPRMPPR